MTNRDCKELCYSVLLTEDFYILKKECLKSVVGNYNDYVTRLKVCSIGELLTIIKLYKISLFRYNQSLKSLLSSINFPSTYLFNRISKTEIILETLEQIPIFINRG